MIDHRSINTHGFIRTILIFVSADARFEKKATSDRILAYLFRQEISGNERDRFPGLYSHVSYQPYSEECCTTLCVAIMRAAGIGMMV